MKLRIIIAIITALIVETINFFFLGFPIDVGYEPGTPWYIQLVGGQWAIVHLPFFLSMDWLHSIGLKGHDTSILFIIGYLDTALLFLIIFCGIPWLFKLAQKASPL